LLNFATIKDESAPGALASVEVEAPSTSLHLTLTMKIHFFRIASQQEAYF
jgi:hypothetical protein